MPNRNDDQLSPKQERAIVALLALTDAGRAERCPRCWHCDLTTVDESGLLELGRFSAPMLTLWAMIRVRSHIQFCIVCGTSHDWEVHPTIQAAMETDADARRMADDLASYGRELIKDGKIPLCERCGAFRGAPVEKPLSEEIEARYTRLAGRAEQVQALASPGSYLKPPA